MRKEVGIDQPKLQHTRKNLVSKMQRARMNHPYVEADERICGGSPVIKGTRLRVVDLAIEYEYLNRSPDEMITSHPHLRLEQVHDALSYYYENREELDQKIKKDKRFAEELAETVGVR